MSAPARLEGPALPAPRFQGVAQMLLHTARTSERGLVFVDAAERETRLPFAELPARAARVAEGLRALGAAPGERVALLFPTSPGFMDAFFGALWAGCVPVPLYPPVRLGRLEEYHRATARMLQLSGAVAVLTDARVRLLLGASVDAARPRLGLHTVDEVARAGGAGAPTPHPALPGELALVQFSSGSTVDPKPVGLTHGALCAQLEALRLQMPLAPGAADVGVSWLPLYHDMGLIGALLTALYYPGELVLLPPEAFLVRPALWLRAISRHRGYVSPAPNFAYGLCLKRVKDAELDGVDLSSWAHALNGAEPVSHGVQERFAERFARWGFRREALRPVYGLSEASLAVTFPPLGRGPRALAVDAGALAGEGRVRAAEGDAPARTLAALGAPVAGFEVEVREGRGRLLAEREVGRVFIRGPSLMRGYVGQPEATARALSPDGWLDTGDVGFVADGELYLCGRAKDLVIIRGANHAPQAFEDALEAVPGVRTGCAVALGFVPPDAEDEQLLLLVERSGPEADDARVAEAARAAVVAATGVRPHTVHLLAPGTLPRTSSGKLRRAEALRQFLGGSLSAPRSVGTVGMALEVARSAWALRRARGATPGRGPG